MIKKLLALTFALCLLGGMLSGCSNHNGTGSETTMETTQKNHPGNDDTLSLLMVGNSFSYYYVEELYGLLIANPDPNRGYEKVRILNLYYSGCRLDQHLNWWKTGTANYQLFSTDENGRHEIETDRLWTLEDALKQGRWDYISLQGSVKDFSYSVPDLTATKNAIGQAAEQLLDYFHQEHPDAQLLWHRTWPFEIGRVSGDTVYDETLLETYNAGIQEVCSWLCSEFTKDKDYSLTQVNSGAAWGNARQANALLETSLIPEKGGLCARMGLEGGRKTFPYYEGEADIGDGYHDGDIGGGQFLNACVWYETITGQSCLDNPYKPAKSNGKYELSDAFADLLRNAAHAVNAK